MKKILVGESTLLVLLLIVAICIRVGVLNQADALDELPQQDDAVQVLSTQPTQTESTQTEPGQTESEQTEPTQTEPEISYLTQIDLVTDFSFAYDCTSGQLLYANGDMDKQIYPASLTKLMTALVVLEYLDPDAWITAGDELDMVAWDASVAYLSKGDCLTVKKLIGGMLMPSGNDAAYVLAVAAGRTIANDMTLSAQEAVSVFMNEVNTQAQIMGLAGTHFTVPDGYHDDNHYTTAGDLLMIALRCLEEPLIMEYAGLTREPVTLQDGVDRVWKNSNWLLDPTSNYYCEQAVGLKTGYTSKAGRCLLAAFREGERTVIVGIFGATDRDLSFGQALTIWNTVQ